jgi:hypothetical protein
MESNATKKYLLAIKRDNNDYLPLEWFRSQLYNGEEFNSLEGIDSFTSRMTKHDLLNDGLKLGLLDLDDKFMDFSIIFHENGKWRELKEGCIFEGLPQLDDEGFVDTIMAFASNKEVINNITNLFNKGFNSEASKQLFMVLKNVGSILESGEDYLRTALEVFKSMPYEERRKLRLSTSSMLVNRIQKNNMAYTKNYNDGKKDDIM